MRTRLLVVCSSLALAPLAVHAQEADPGQEDAPAQEMQGETQETDVVPPQAGNQPGQVHVPGAQESAPGQVHTVVRGDTLWDLSEEYLGTPWYWPKVWSYNPQIANPHWIYPGNQIRFYPAGEENAARVAVAGPEGASGEIAPSEGMEDEGGVQVTGKIGFTVPPSVSASHEGFVTPREIAEAGTIDHSPSEALMLSYPDLVYVRFRNPGQAKVGETYPVFHTVKEVDHPRTGKSLGYLTEIVGKVRVVKLGRGEATAQIVASSDEIRRGDKVGAPGEPLHTKVAARPNARALKGYVVSALTPYLTIMGEESKLLVDLGSAQGVQPGNTFTVIRQTDPQASILDPNEDEDRSLPIEDIATCMAVTVKEHVSTCILVRSLKEVVPGDRVEMRTGNMQVGMR